MMKWTAFTSAAWLVCTLAAVHAQDPFSVDVHVKAGAPPRLEVTFGIPEEHYLYDHMLAVAVADPEEVTLTPVNPPTPKTRYDELLEQEVATYGSDTTFTFDINGLDNRPFTLQVAYQGCDDTTCFLPQQREFRLTIGESTADAVAAAPATTEADTHTAEADWRALAERFRITATDMGYMDSNTFIDFLERGAAGTAPEENLLETVFNRFGIVVALLLVIPMGLLLNLTPCVLPMIPINLAIIGAGNAAGSKRTGFLRGAVYGAGMALVYGILGVVVVLSGSQFGALNTNPWFNLGIAVVFIALALAMFDVFVIDFSRFQTAGPTPGKASKSPWVTAFLLGGTAALLAGACVAPVLIWVLVLATDLFAKGSPSGLLLPFMLGVGMAIPWPIAGAGLAAIPKPGNWMNRVKHGFGVLIVLFAVYYGVLGVRQLRARSAEGTHAGAYAEAEDDWIASLEKGLREGLRERKPVLLDFWALSCKSCMKMKRTTFKDPEVIAALDDHVKIAFQTDDMSDPVVKGALEYFEVLGLPTYVLLEPKDRQ